MTTDNKTLADVQPGGRVRLGDQAHVTMSEDDFANLVEGEAGEHGEMLEDGGPYSGWCFSCEELIAFSRGIINAWGMERHAQVAALSAQPSPGGQDVREKFESWALRNNFSASKWPDGDYIHESMRLAWKVWQYLAASQPHGKESCEDTDAELQFYREEVLNLPNILIGAGVFSVDHDGDYKAAWANIIAGIERLAARQPVGEPVAVVTTSDRFAYGKLNRELPDGTELYAAPPAQAVDLGQFRQPVQDWLDDAQASMEEHGDYDGVFGYAIEEGTRLLGLIDSHSAGGQP